MKPECAFGFYYVVRFYFGQQLFECGVFIYVYIVVFAVYAVNIPVKHSVCLLETGNGADTDDNSAYGQDDFGFRCHIDMYNRILRQK